jgi:hypothetical protein
MANNTEIKITADTKQAVKAIDDLNKKIVDIQKTVRKTVFAFTAANAAIVAFTSKFTGYAANMNNLSDTIGVNIEQLQRLKYAAEQTNSSGEALFGTLQGLTNKIGNAALRGDETFNMLGINVRDSNGQVKNAAEVLEEVRQKLQLINNIQLKHKIMGDLGIDASLYKFLNLTTEEMEKYNKEAEELGIISKEDAKRAEVFRDKLRAVKFQLGILSTELALDFAPIITKVADKLMNFIKENRTDIREFGQDIAKAFRWISQIFGDFWDLLVKIFGSKGAGYLVGGAFLAMITPANILKVILSKLGLFIGVFALAIQDLYYFITGKGDSLTGAFWDWLRSGEGILANLQKAFEGLILEIGKLFDLDLTKWLDKWGDALNNIINTIFPLKTALEAINGLYDKFNGAKESLSSNIFQEAGNRVKNFASSGIDGISQGIDSVYNWFAGTPNDTTVNNNISINVTGSEPYVTAKLVEDNIKGVFVNTPYTGGGR